MTSEPLSRIHNFRACNVGYPKSLEIEAIIEEVATGWDFTSTEATAEQGVSEIDREGINELIETEGLSVTSEEACAALLAWCRERCAEASRDE